MLARPEMRAAFRTRSPAMPSRATHPVSARTSYGPCQEAETTQATFLICGNLWDFAESATAADASGTLQANYVSAVEGTSVVLNPICSSGPLLYGIEYDFTATADRLTLEMSSNGAIFVGVYERQ